MKDLSIYSYQELYDMMNHINPFKYQDRIEAVRQEIEVRKANGEVPTALIPDINYGYLFRGFGWIQIIYCMFIMLSIPVFVVSGQYEGSQVLLITPLIILIGLFLGAIFLLKEMNLGVVISLPFYLAQIIVFASASFVYKIVFGIVLVVGYGTKGFITELSFQLMDLNIGSGTTDDIFLGINLISLLPLFFMSYALIMRKSWGSAGAVGS